MIIICRNFTFRTQIFLAVFILFITLGFVSPQVALAINNDISIKQRPSIDKYLSNDTDGTYRLSLEVTGDSESETEVKGADIVLILDISSSMSESFDGYDKPKNERFDTAIKASKHLAEIVMGNNKNLNNPSEKTRIAIVTFDANAQLKMGFNDSLDSTLENIDRIEISRGTNWSAGIATGVDEMSKSRPNASKYYVFMTDGEPYQGEMIKGEIYDNRKKLFDDYTISKNFAKRADYCVNQVNESYESIPYDHFYNIICGKTEGYYVLNAFDRYIKKSSFVDGSNKKDFENAFSQIGYEINHYYGYSHVQINDTLSSWADMQLDNGKPKNLSFEKIKNGQSTPIADGLDRFSCDPATKSISWKPVPDGQSLEHHATYRVSFDISPSQMAFDAAANCVRENSELPDLGIGSDKNEHKGFYSNAMANGDTIANLVYSINTKTVNSDGQVVEVVSDPHKILFPKPVMDVPVSKLVVSKIWSDGNENHANEVVAYKVLRDGDEFLTGELSNANNWRQEQFVSAGPKGHTYTVKELPVDGYTTSVSKDGITFVDEVSIESQLQGLQETQSSVTFKNTAAYGINVYKYIQGNIESALAGAEFTLYKNVDDNDGYFNDVDKEQVLSTLTTDGTGTINFTNLEPGSYWLVETKVPTGYTLMNNAIQIDINRVSANDTTFTATRYSDDLQSKQVATMDTVNSKGLVGKISVANKEIPSIPVCGKNPITELATIGLGLMISAICISMGMGLRNRRLS